MSKDYEVGYGKPPVHTRFGAGNRANPIGKTSAHRKAEIAAAELAAKVRLEMVEALSDAFDNAESKEKIEQIRSDVLRLLKDSEDRGFGQATQPIDNTSSDGSMSPTKIEIVAVGNDSAD